MTNQISCHVCEGKLPKFPVRNHDGKLFCSLDCFRDFGALIK